MSYSKLVDHVRLSPNCTKPRNQKINAIVIHHVAGNATVEALGRMFADPARQACSNYGVGTDGRIGCYCEEEDRSWCSGSREIDNRAITLEVANCSGDPDWKVSDQALEATIALCADICKRYGFKLNYTGDKTGNLHMHKWYQATGCPGPYLESKFPYIAEEVNKRLGYDPEVTEPSKSKEIIYRIRKSWGDVKSQKGAYNSLENAKNACPEGYTVYDEEGNPVYSKEAKTVTVDYAASFDKAKAGTYKVTATGGVNLRSGASTGKDIIETIPNGSKVQCYGYFTKEWLYVVADSGKKGFCHGYYLEKV